MDAIGLNPIKLDAIGLDPIRMDAIRLGVPGASSGSERPYIDPELLSHVKMAISTWGKTNDDPDRAVLKDLSGNGNDMRLLNFGFTEGSGYGLPGTDFEGWLCTDGVDDMIVSEKTVDEMIGDSKECTVISIINYISDIAASTNVFGRRYIRNSFIGNGIDGKYYICGYTSKNIDERGNVTVINDILGDKNDFSANYVAVSGVADYFSVTGYLDGNNVPQRCVKIAYAGGFIANKVLTTDEINQIIAYFNLDRPGQIIKPQLYCNIKKQGITNDNHAEFNDQLIDFVGGHNIQLNNIAWEGESGINSYPVVFGTNKTWETLTSEYIGLKYDNTPSTIIIHEWKDKLRLLYSYVRVEGVANKIEIPEFIANINGLKEGENIRYCYISEYNRTKVSDIYIKKNGITTFPKSYIIEPTEETPINVWIGVQIIAEGDCNITIEVLPTIENALCLDGISDFGKATGLPVLKDYTVVADRELLSNNGIVLSKAKNIIDGAFIFESNGSTPKAYSFGGATDIEINNNREISYQSKYIYNGQTINASTQEDFDMMWLAITRDSSSIYSKFALWSLMLFPYSLSEFLLERQLRKYKAGTLYPDMIEFRPVIKSNVPYSSISYSVNPGMYVTEGSAVTITITLSNETDKLVGVSSNAISDISISGDNGVYEITGKVTKSPQKISIAIDEYIRYEDIIQPYPFVVPIYDENDNLISWGDKLRVGSTIRYQRVYNLIPELYLADIIYYNGNVIDGTGGTLIAEKEMVFSNRKTWLLSTAEPLFIYDPSMINNVGLQNLGYLPDLTGQRRHLKLNNMAYDEESGIGTDGALHYDGVDDHGIVQSLSHGGQCLIMKANWNVVEKMMFDQRLPVNTVNTFSIYLSSLDKDNNTVPAYQSRNDGGETYIDNVLNKYVGVRDLMGKTHVITATNGNSDDSNTVSPKFGCSNVISMFCQFAMFRTMLLPAIPSSEDRTTINNWCGIEGGYVEKAEYYWDAHGKTNADPDKNTIKNRGTEQSLISNSSPTNLQTDWIANEFTFVNSASDVDIMSGDRLASTAYEARFLTGQVIPAMQVTLTLVNSAYDTFSYMYVDEEGSSQRIYFNDLVLNEPVTVDLPKNNNNNTNTGFILEANNPNAVINVKVLLQSVNIENAFDLEANNLAYTDESGYKENGLYLDGVEDYLVNPNVPAFTDYTYIFKREILANDTINSVTMHKGLVKEFAGGFTVDYVIDDVDNFVYHSFGRGNVVSRKSVENSIIYGTTTSVNGITINRGSNTDDNSITIGKYASNYRKMVFCKLALFSKTIDMLSINMLRNLFELDEIIDLNNKLFKK